MKERSRSERMEERGLRQERMERTIQLCAAAAAENVTPSLTAFRPFGIE